MYKQRLWWMSGWLLVALLLVGGIRSAAQPDSPLPCTETAGRIERPAYRSTLIDTPMVYSIYLPPCYDQTTTRYPVIYLLHGSNDDDNHWLRLGWQAALDARIASGAMPPAIVVLPFGNWIANENQFGTYSWANVFLTELLPLVEATYRVETRRAYRVIGGISRGGFWAFQLAFTYPDLFSAVGGHSAFFDRYHAPAEYNPLDLALTLTPETAPRILLDRGAFDYAAPGLDIMHDRLNQAAILHNYFIYPAGEHNNTYWGQHLEEYLDFYVAAWVDRPASAQAAPTDTPTDAPTEATPLFITNTPRPEITPVPTTGGSSAAKYVLLPAVAFPSKLVNLSRDHLLRVLAGEPDPKLVLTASTAAILLEHSRPISPETQLISDDELYRTLWSDRTRWTLLPFEQFTPRYRVLWVDEQNPLDHPADLGSYPLAFDSATPNFDPAQLTRIMLSGVTALTRRSMPVFDERGMTWAGEAIAPITTQTDFFHTSNEVSLVETCPQAAAGAEFFGGFCSKPAYFEVLTQIGVDIVELSGNHNNDYGYDAYRDSLAWYAERGIRTVGGGETLADARAPLLIDHNGNRIAWLTCNQVGPYYALVNEDPNLLGGVRPGAADCNRDWLRVAIPDLTATYDTVIVTLQYLESDQYTPLPRQRDDFAWLAAQGADVVIGTQAHWSQTYNFAPQDSGGEAFIHYGLGNFIFDQPWWANSRFFMDELYIYNGELRFVDVYTGIIEDLGRPRLMTPEERDIFLHLMFVDYGGL